MLNCCVSTQVLLTCFETGEMFIRIRIIAFQPIGCKEKECETSILWFQPCVKACPGLVGEKYSNKISNVAWIECACGNAKSFSRYIQALLNNYCTNLESTALAYFPYQVLEMNLSLINWLCTAEEKLVQIGCLPIIKKLHEKHEVLVADGTKSTVY